MTGHKISFDGHFGKYFVISLCLFLLTLLTLGLAGVYWTYWNRKYFFTKLRIGDQRIAFRGSFGEYFFTLLGLALLSAITFGLALPYAVYWSYKYFFTCMELVPVVGASPVAPVMHAPASTSIAALKQTSSPPAAEKSKSADDQPEQKTFQFISPD